MKIKPQTLWVGALATSLILCLAWIYNLMNGASFFFDEWDFLIKRGLNTNDLLRPHNGHFSLIPVLIFVVLRKIFGMSSYAPFQIAGLAVHASVCVVVYVILRRRSHAVALSAAVVVCVLGSGWQNILWLFQIGMMGAFGAGLWAFNEINREIINRWRVSLFIGISLACAGGGIAVTMVVLSVILIRRQWRVLSALVPTLVLYGMWYLKYGQSQSQDGNLGKTIQYIVDSALAAGAGTASKSLVFGGFVLGIVLVLLVLNQRGQKVTSLPNVVVAFLLVTWALTGLSRAHLGEPGASRYVYVGATCLVLLVALLIPISPTRFSTIGNAVFAVLLISPNVTMMRAGANGLLDTSMHLRVELAAIEHVRETVDPAYSIDAARAPQLVAGEYLSAIDRFGSPGYSWEELVQLPSGALADVNRTLAQASSALSFSHDFLCSSNRAKNDGSVVLRPDAMMNIAVRAPATLKFNWFKESPDAAYAVEISTSGTYVLQNLIEKESNILNVSGDMQSMAICKQS